MCIIQGYRSYPFQRVGQVENDPSEGAGCKVQCAAFKAGRDIHGSVLCLLVYIVGCLCEIGGEVCYEIRPMVSTTSPMMNVFTTFPFVMGSTSGKR